MGGILSRVCHRWKLCWEGVLTCCAPCNAPHSAPVALPPTPHMHNTWVPVKGLRWGLGLGCVPAPPNPKQLESLSCSLGHAVPGATRSALEFSTRDLPKARELGGGRARKGMGSLRPGLHLAAGSGLCLGQGHLERGGGNFPPACTSWPLHVL